MSYRRLFAGIAVIAAVLLAAVVSSASAATSTKVPGAPASTSDIVVQACQGAGAELRYTYQATGGGTDVWQRNCSGVYSLNSTGVSVYTGAWSGYVIIRADYPIYFCNRETVPIGNKHVDGMYLSPTRAAWC